MKSIKEILVFFFILFFLSNTPVTKEIEICKIGGKQHICGKGKDNSGYVDNVNVQFYTTCAAVEKGNDYSCACVHETISGIRNEIFDGYDDSDVETYDTNYLIYDVSNENSTLSKAVYNSCFIGTDCRDITDKNLCLNATQCEYINGGCRAKCANHISADRCKKDNKCKIDTENNDCTNSSILPVFNLISIIIFSLFLI